MISEIQIAALKYLIFKAHNTPDLSKRIMSFLIDQSEKLTKEVVLTLIENREDFSGEEIREAAYGIDRMLSSNGATHINEVLLATGSDLDFSIHYGDFDPNREPDHFNNAGQLAGMDRSLVFNPESVREGMPLRYTFWLSIGSYSRTASLVKVDREILEKIDLAKPGLYPVSEKGTKKI